MIRQIVVRSLRALAVSFGSAVDGSQWHLFGSVDRNEHDAGDIDLMILCKDDKQADMLRRAIDPEAFELPLHLALLTFDEAVEADAVRLQQSRLIFP